MKFGPPHLMRFGEATKTQTRRSVAHVKHDIAARLEAKASLLYPAVKFDGMQALAIVNGIADITRKLGVNVHALAVMPDHLHMVTARHEMPVEDLGDFLKRAATRRLNAEGLHPLAEHRNRSGRTPSPWAGGGWYVYLDTEAEVRGRVFYVENNPVKAGLRRQHWRLVKPWGG